MHLNEATSSLQEPLFKQGATVQSSMFVSHISPVKPSLHMHMYLLSRSTHLSVPIGLHGSLRHSSIGASHCKPVYPGLHLQTNPSSWSMQLAPF